MRSLCSERADTGRRRVAAVPAVVTPGVAGPRGEGAGAVVLTVVHGAGLHRVPEEGVAGAGVVDEDSDVAAAGHGIAGNQETRVAAGGPDPVVAAGHRVVHDCGCRARCSGEAGDPDAGRVEAVAPVQRV